MRQINLKGDLMVKKMSQLVFLLIVEWFILRHGRPSA